MDIMRAKLDVSTLRFGEGGTFIYCPDGRVRIAYAITDDDILWFGDGYLCRASESYFPTDVEKDEYRSKRKSLYHKLVHNG